jgi:hypothetical protein
MSIFSDTSIRYTRRSAPTAWPHNFPDVNPAIQSPGTFFSRIFGLQVARVRYPQPRVRRKAGIGGHLVAKQPAGLHAEPPGPELNYSDFQSLWHTEPPTVSQPYSAGSRMFHR